MPSIDDEAEELEALRKAMREKKSSEADNLDEMEGESEYEDEEYEEEGSSEEDKEGYGEWTENDEEWETEEDDADADFEIIYESQQDLQDRLPSPKKSLPDVEGAIPKSILRKLPNSTIRKIIIHVKKHILMLETENYLYEKTIEKLEASEKEIDSRLPTNADEFEDHLKKTRVLICSSDSEPEPEDTGNYEPINAADEIRVSQDSFFENMSETSLGTAFQFFKTVGDLAPSNYDVMRHKYGDYVGTAAERMDFTGEPGVRTRLNTKVFHSRLQLDDKMSTAAANVLKPAGKNSLTERPSVSSQGSVEDEDFAGFNLADAKKLSITDRLRFAIEEEDEFRKRFYHHETQALKDESSIQVHIDAHKHALAILMGIRKDFRLITKGATGVGMNGKIMADMLVKFRRKMRNQLSAEETKARISIRKVMAQRKRTLEQLKINKEAGRSISHIDFEYLLCESSILEAEISGMNSTLQHLKDLTAQFHLVLQDERQMLDKMVGQEKTMNQELKRRHELLHHFHDSYVRYRQQIVEANIRMENIKKKLSEFQAPQPLDYIKLKASQYELESDMHNLERKLDEVSLTLISVKGDYNQYVKHLPGGKTTEMENMEWLEEIRKEVEDKGLMQTLDYDEEEEEEEAHSSFSGELLDVAKSKSAIGVGFVSTAWIDSHHQQDHHHPHHDPPHDHHQHDHSHHDIHHHDLSKRSTIRLPNAPTLLLAPRRFDAHKIAERRSRAPIYDLDFDFDPDSDYIDEDLDKDTGKADE